MYFHSRNDSKYIAELRQALIESGLQDREPIERKYILKENFKESNIYKKGYIFSNKRIPADRSEITSLEDNMKVKTYKYSVKTNKGNVVSLVEEENVGNSNNNLLTIKFKDIDYNILLGSAERFNELRFDVIKSKYPNVKTMREFLTSDDYLGNSSLEIKYDDSITGEDLRNACINAMTEISNHVVSIKQEYKGTKQFDPIKINTVLKDKSIYLSKIDSNGGKGDSQNRCVNDNYRLDLSNEDWYVFNDNYGTSEEKLFIKYFKTNIEPKLIEKNLDYYVIRNERIPELAIYSFNSGDRFEPDFLLFVTKKDSEDTITHQVYAEPKGSNLLLEDKWKEEFMEQLVEDAITNPLFDYGNNYKIIGLPFYNEEYKKSEFEEAINVWLNEF